MPEIVIRLAILALVGIATWLLAWTGRRFVEAQRCEALAATVPGTITVSEDMPESASTVGLSPIRILAFSSADCHQCHRLQAPVLKRVLEARGETVTIVDVDATTEHRLVQTYHVLTVPSTVVLDAIGNTHAVNYGFANTQRLLKQVDEVLAKVEV
jgi:hypothetical protein